MKNIFKKIIIVITVSVLFCNVIYASNAPIYYRTPLDGPLMHTMDGPIDNTLVTGSTGTERVLLNYYNEQLLRYKPLNNYHEENFIYSNGQHGVSYYDGMLTYAIKDFDNDEKLEMALFKITTNAVDEFSNKEITLDIVKEQNGMAVLMDTMVISSEQYLGEEIECDISMKYVNEMWRIYINYFDKKVREQQYESKFKALEYNELLNVVGEVNLSADGEDYYDGSTEFQDQIIDSGINLQDDANIYKKAFLNDDLQVVPLFTIKRINEKIRDGFIEDYFEQNGGDMNNEQGIKLRYGYTQFIERK